MAKIENVLDELSRIIYDAADLFKDQKDRPPYGPDEHGILRGASLIAHVQARRVLESFGLLDGAAEATTYSEHGTKHAERFFDDYVVSDTMTTRREVLKNTKRLPGSIAVKRSVLRIEGPWIALDPSLADELQPQDEED